MSPSASVPARAVAEAPSAAPSTSDASEKHFAEESKRWRETDKAIGELLEKMRRQKVGCATVARWVERQRRQDGWKKEFRGACNEGKPEIQSAGPNGRFGGGDDAAYSYEEYFRPTDVGWKEDDGAF